MRRYIFYFINRVNIALSSIVQVELYAKVHIFLFNRLGRQSAKVPLKSVDSLQKDGFWKFFGLHGYVRLLREKRKGGLPLPLL